MSTKKITLDSKNFLPQAFLYWEHEGLMEKKEFEGFLSIGRGPNNLLVLEDDFASRTHARIEKKEEKGLYLLRDMNSRNGVFLNGSRIHQALLKPNDSIQIGKTHFTFSFERYNHKWKIISQSRNKKWNETLSRIPSLALSDAPILILGPSGSGKELIAQMIHSRSKRSSENLISINCGALTESLAESELFGHKKGSYTGSSQDRKGAFIAASKGTLFMDEIGDLPLTMQPKLLRAIEYKEIKPLGSDFTMKADVRIVSATHQDLKSKAERKEFREDLFYRLNVVTIRIPALKERMEDFESLFKYFSLAYGVSFSSAAFKVLSDYHWPGNIRELKNLMERAKALYPAEILDKEKTLAVLDRFEEQAKKQEEPLWLIEKNFIIKALEKNQGNQRKASSALGIPRSSLCDKLKAYNIDMSAFKRKPEDQALSKSG